MPASAPSGDACDGGLGLGASCDGKGAGIGVPSKAHNPHALRVEASLVGTAPGLPGEVVIYVVRRNLPSLRRCHSDALADGGTSATGHVRIGFEIDAAGKAAKVRDAGSTLEADVVGCMVRVIEGVSFPVPERAPASEIVEVKVSPP